MVFRCAALRGASLHAWQMHKNVKGERLTDLGLNDIELGLNLSELAVRNVGLFQRCGHVCG